MRADVADRDGNQLDFKCTQTVEASFMRGMLRMHSLGHHYSAATSQCQWEWTMCCEAVTVVFSLSVLVLTSLVTHTYMSIDILAVNVSQSGALYDVIIYAVCAA